MTWTWDSGLVTWAVQSDGSFCLWAFLVERRFPCGDTQFSSLLTCQDFLPADIQTQFAVSRELIRNIYNSFYKLRDRAERIAARAIDNAADLLIFGKELRQVALLGSMGG